ncbi:hypothetical protein EON73_03900, partial [bacterium]
MILEASGSKQTSDKNYLPPASIAKQIWNEDDWFIHHMEWKLEYEPLSLNKQNMNELVNSKQEDSYEEDYLLQKITLNTNTYESEIKSNKLKFNFIPDTYKGRALITPSARSNLLNKFNDYLKHTNDIPEEISNVIKNLTSKLIDAPILSQTLDGFNQGLIGLKSTPQLKVSDPTDTAPLSKKFCNETVPRAVDIYNRTAPSANSTYNPIQDGKICIKQLRFIDIFGRFQDLNIENVIYSQAIKSAVDNKAKLPNRLI